MTGDVLQIRTRGASRNARTGGNGGDMAADGEGAQLTTDKLAPAIHSHAIAYSLILLNIGVMNFIWGAGGQTSEWGDVAPRSPLESPLIRTNFPSHHVHKEIYEQARSHNLLKVMMTTTHVCKILAYFNIIFSRSGIGLYWSKR